MARGSKPGERRGGRKKGTPNKRTDAQTAEIQQYIKKHAVQVLAPTESIFDPVEALCELTEWAMKEFRAVEDARTDDGKLDVESAKLKVSLANVAADWAAKAAPYIRPRLSAVEAKVNVSVSVFERIERGRQRALSVAA